MSATRYLVPCKCGRGVPAEPGQAGEMVACACGEKLEVPSLAALRRLPTAQADGPARPKSGWAIQHALYVLAVILALLSLGSAVSLWARPPISPRDTYSAELLQKHLDGLSPAATYEFFEQQRSNALTMPSRREMEAYEGHVLRWRLSLVLGPVVIAVIAVGVALAARWLAIAGRTRPSE